MSALFLLQRYCSRRMPWSGQRKRGKNLPVRRRRFSNVAPNSRARACSSRALNNREANNTAGAMNPRHSPNNQGRTDQVEDHSWIGRMPNASVRSGADELVGMLQSDGGGPMCPSTKRAQKGQSLAARHESAGRPASFPASAIGLKRMTKTVRAVRSKEASTLSRCMIG